MINLRDIITKDSTFDEMLNILADSILKDITEVNLNMRQLALHLKRMSITDRQLKIANLLIDRIKDRSNGEQWGAINLLIHMWEIYNNKEVD